MTTSRKDSTYPGKEDPTYSSICVGCMSYKGKDAHCRKCGHRESDAETHQVRLKPRTILKSQYLIGEVLGQGGFGITYLGLDLVLHKKVAIKEFLPSMLATRDSDKTSVIPNSGSMEQLYRQGLQSFIGEARSVAQFSRHINIVNVNNYFEANNTGYMVMDYLEGEPVSKLIVKRGGRLSLHESFSILSPILEALTEVHKMEIYHRDISPQNIILTVDNTPVLIDFGAARQVAGGETYSLDVILKHGYSPLEQYMSRGKIGPWTDVYACGATLYHMITGKLPPRSIERVYSDELVQPIDFQELNISEEFNDTMLTCLAVRASDRFQSVEEFKGALEKGGYIGYRRLLQTFLRDRAATLENRMTLDTFVHDYRLNHDDAKLMEETVREESNLPRLDWASEFRENYQSCLNAHPDGIQPALNQQFLATYVHTKRISQGTASEIIRSITETNAVQEEETLVAGPMRVQEDQATIAESMRVPEETATIAQSMRVPEELATIAEPPHVPLDKATIAEPIAPAEERAIIVEPARVPEEKEAIAVPTPVPEGKVGIAKPVGHPTTWIMKAVAAAAVIVCIVFGVKVFLSVQNNKGEQHGFINVWSKPPAEIYVNGKFMGLSPVSDLKVPSGEVKIRLLNKEQHIDETYTELIEPASKQVSN